MSLAANVATKLRLVISISHEDGSYRNAWFKVVSIHRAKSAARKIAVKARKKGYLARVRRVCSYWVVAVRRPRKKAPFWRDLEV